MFNYSANRSRISVPQSCFVLLIFGESCGFFIGAWVSILNAATLTTYPLLFGLAIGSGITNSALCIAGMFAMNNVWKSRDATTIPQDDCCSGGDTPRFMARMLLYSVNGTLFFASTLAADDIRTLTLLLFCELGLYCSAFIPLAIAEKYAMQQRLQQQQQQQQQPQQNENGATQNADAETDITTVPPI
jgi:hypothetical protein